MAIFFWLIVTNFAASTVYVIVKRRQGAAKWPCRIAIGLAGFLVAFPLIRSWLSNDGRGDFHPAGAMANLEWWLVIVAMGPIHLVCMYVIAMQSIPRRETPGD